MDNDLSNVLGILQSKPEKKNEKSVLEQLQENLTAIQKQLDGLKAEEDQLEKADKPVSIPQNASRIDIARDRLSEAIHEEAKESQRIISASITTAPNKEGSSSYSSMCIEDNIDDINEEVLSAKLEPFTNPKRIAILKALQNEDLTATDISMKTRCVGGQLYHHLNNLGNAGLIVKKGDKFRLDNKAILVALNTVTCLVNNSRNDAEVFVYEEKEPNAEKKSDLENLLKLLK